MPWWMTATIGTGCAIAVGSNVAHGEVGWWQAFGAVLAIANLLIAAGEYHDRLTVKKE
jgi:hypothetical protein